MSGMTMSAVMAEETRHSISSRSLDSNLSRGSHMSPAPLDLGEAQSGGAPALSRASSKFQILPKGVIQNILWTVDSNTFASLCFLNRQWYQAAQVVELYAHHLSRCPSYALANTVITGPFRRNELYRLKTKFAAEVRRNLFDAYIRPRRTFINFISVNANSSAAFPGGEAFRFEFSPNGRTVLALSSSRIYVLDATATPLMVKRELKTLRRPLSASITDDGSLLAVLSSKYQANVYVLPPRSKIKHLQVIVLDHSPRTIAIAHEGTVLAASYETGVEVFSLAANAMSTDRRAVRSEAVDTLTFSGDGSMLVGSSLSLEDPNAVVISAPFYTENDPDLSPREVHSRMWTTQILFPQISSVCSHVALLPGHNESDATWLFAYDHSLLSYRAVRTDDTRAGVAYFLSPPSARRFSMPSPTIAPTASACGTLVVAGFSGTGLCLYGIPEKLDITPDMGAVLERHERRTQRRDLPLTTATGNMEPLMAYSPSVSGISDSIEDDSIASKVDWRQSVFVKCKPLESISGHTSAKWVERPDDDAISFPGKRLLVVAPGGVGTTSLGLGDEDMPIDGSRICLLDFDYAPGSAGDQVMTIEVGENEAELLVEHTGTIANEVAMERRRTIRAIPSGENARMLLTRSATSISPPPIPFLQEGGKRGSVSSPSSPVDGPLSSPLDPTITGIQRSSTTAGFRHALYPPRPPIGLQHCVEPGTTRPNAGMGRRSSADSWETPPPPYPQGSLNASSPPGNVSATLSQGFGVFSVPDGANPQSGFPEQRSVSPIGQHSYIPYRAFNPRINPTPETSPTADSVPTRRSGSQYGALARTRRSYLDTVAESPNHRQDIRDINLSTPFAPDTIQQDFAPQSQSQRRSLTHHADSPNLTQGPQHSDAVPISPMGTGDRQSTFNSMISAETPHQLTLTGANLQNRLNHPVPPLPEQSTVIPAVPSTNFQPVLPHSQPFDPDQDSQPVHQPTGLSDQFPMMPTADQLARLSNRQSHSHMQRPSVLHHTNTAPSLSDTHQIQMRVPPSPPRAAWGAAGVPGSPSFHQARNISLPNGVPGTLQYSQPAFRHNNHNLSQLNGYASASTPNLNTRPPYGRLDTIESIDDSTERDVRHGRAISGAPDMRSGYAGMVNANVMSGMERYPRAQSLIMDSREQSAYNETRRAGPDVGVGKKGKKKRKGEDSGEGGRKGSRCVVM